MVRTALAAGAPVVSLVATSNQPPLVSGDGHLIVGQSVNHQLVVVETVTQATWDLPLTMHPSIS